MVIVLLRSMAGQYKCSGPVLVGIRSLFHYHGISRGRPTRRSGCGRLVDDESCRLWNVTTSRHCLFLSDAYRNKSQSMRSATAPCMLYTTDRVVNPGPPVFHSAIDPGKRHTWWKSHGTLVRLRIENGDSKPRASPHSLVVPFDCFSG